MKSLQLYVLLILTIIPNVYLQAMIKDSGDDQENRIIQGNVGVTPGFYNATIDEQQKYEHSKVQQDEKPLYILSELGWLPHGEKKVCDCPKMGTKLTRINVWNDFWEKIAGCLPKERNEGLRTLLRKGYFFGQYPCWRRFVAAAVYAGANPNVEEYECDDGSTGNRPLGLAVGREDYYLTKLLLKHGAYPNLKVDLYSPALFLAENKKLAELLLRYGANVNDRGGKFKHTILCKVSFDSDHEVNLIQLYIDAGANVNEVTDQEGNTLLHLLALDYCLLGSKKVLEKAQILLAAGADLEIANKEGKTVIAFCNDTIANCNGLTGKNPRRKELLEEKCKRAQSLLKILQAAKSKSIVKR